MDSFRKCARKNIKTFEEKQTKKERQKKQKRKEIFSPVHISGGFFLLHAFGASPHPKRERKERNGRKRKTRPDLLFISQVAISRTSQALLKRDASRVFASPSYPPNGRPSALRDWLPDAPLLCAYPLDAQDCDPQSNSAYFRSDIFRFPV